MSTYRRSDEQPLLQIRETIIAAVASDDLLVDRLVLKGGNALDIAYRLGQRSSLDVDFSMSGDFQDEAEARVVQDRLFAALRERFDALGYVVFDEKFENRPRENGGPGVIWGGYNATFKLVSRKRFLELGGTPGAPPTGPALDALRHEANVTGIGSQRNFLIEISKFEHTTGKQIVEVAGFDCFVYTPAMIAAEKLRAICQQSPLYPQRRNPTPRPRDFFDIHTVATLANCDLAAPYNHDLVRAMFAAKDVHLQLLADLKTPERRVYHALGWPAVLDAVRGGVQHGFDYYFDFVVGESERLLQALGVALPSSS